MQLGASQGILREHSKNTQSTIREHSELTEGTSKKHRKNIQRTFREHSENTLRTCIAEQSQRTKQNGTLSEQSPFPSLGPGRMGQGG